MGQTQPEEQTDASAKKREYVYLLHANETRYNQSINADAQILTGEVAFRHDSLYMYCDSALFYEATNSLQAFGQVHMVQGDTLFLDGEELYYDGDAMLAQIRYNVCMKDPRMVLTTDSLNYDRTINLGYYFEGGTLKDSVNTLTSDWGEYDTTTKDAVFNYNVTLTNDNFVLTSDTLGYNTVTRIATITGPSDIVNDDNHIHTTLGYYFTNEDQALLSERSALYNADDRLVGDSLFYDHKNGYGEAFHNVVMDDFKDKCRLTGDYVYYNEICDSAYATQRAIAIDYSQGDSLFIHADTLVLTTHDRFPPAEELAEELDSMASSPGVPSSLTDTLTQMVDSITQSADSIPIPNDSLAVMSDSLLLVSTDSTAMATDSLGTALSKEEIELDSIATELSSNGTELNSSGTELNSAAAESDSISAILDSLGAEPGLAALLPDTIPMPMDSLSMDSIALAAAASDTIVTPPAPVDSTYRIIKGYHKVRIFRSDIQAVCDSLVCSTLDSCITMYTDPIIWNGHQQVLGEKITIYLNDSTIDWVHIEEQALMVEQLDTVHYNQISGREIKAYFDKGEIEHTDVIGNVLVIYYYQEENDSILLGMNTTEASQLTAFMVDRQVDKLLITNKSNGTFYPMLQIPPEKMKLSTFGWFSHIRPLSQYDILFWRGKNDGEKLKKSPRSAVPLPSLKGLLP